MSSRSRGTRIAAPFQGSRSSTSFGNTKAKGGQIDVNNLPPRAKSTNSKTSKSSTRALKKRDSNGVSPTIGRFSGRNGGRVGKQCNTVEDIVRCIASGQAKNIVVMAGAGISTASGIPDFRSPGTGLYDNLRRYRIPQPQAIFDRDYFEGNPHPFFTLAKELYPGKYKPNSTHYFLRLLHEKGLLLRVYTQNIDGLERMAGIPPMKIVEAHGSFQTASCIRCRQSQPPDEIKSAIMSNRIPRCRKSGCLGLVKPDIVFFGEDLPKRFFYYLKDFPQADLLIVMGTSLEVEPFAEIVDSVRHFVPRILFNRVAVGPFRTKRRMSDVCSLGDLDTNLSYFSKMLGWSSDLKTLIEKYQEPEAKEPVPSSTLSSSPVSTSSLERDLSKLSLNITPKKAEVAHLPSVNHRLKKNGSKSAGSKLLAEGRPPLPVHRNPPRYGNAAWAKPVSFHAQKHLYRTNAQSSSEEELFAQDDEDSSSSDED